MTWVSYLVHSQLDLSSERHEGTHHGHHPEEEEEDRGATASHPLQLDDAQHQDLERQKGRYQKKMIRAYDRFTTFERERDFHHRYDNRDRLPSYREYARV